MSYIIMALDECGTETRVSDFDKHYRGFDRETEAYRNLDKAQERYPEFRQFWVEELRDASYWLERMNPYSEGDYE